LHAVIASCKLEQNGNATASASEDAAAKVVEYLLVNGAIWNDLNKANETPRYIAFLLGQTKIYDIIVDAGVRAELLFDRLERLDGPIEENDMIEDESSQANQISDDSEYDMSQDNGTYLKLSCGSDQASF
jgi:type IV protein arginine methyltransferase